MWQAKARRCHASATAGRSGSHASSLVSALLSGLPDEHPLPEPVGFNRRRAPFLFCVPQTEPQGGASVVDSGALDNYSLIKSTSNSWSVTAKDDGTRLLSVSTRSGNQPPALH